MKDSVNQEFFKNCTSWFTILSTKLLLKSQTIILRKVKNILKLFPK